MFCVLRSCFTNCVLLLQCTQLCLWGGNSWGMRWRQKSKNTTLYILEEKATCRFRRKSPRDYYKIYSTVGRQEWSSSCFWPLVTLFPEPVFCCHSIQTGQTDRTEQTEQDRQNRTDKTGQTGLDTLDWTDRTRQAGLDWTGQTEQGRTRLSHPPWS